MHEDVTMTEDTVKAISLHRRDVDAASCSASAYTGPAHRPPTDTAPNLTYAPTPNYIGADSVHRKASDGALDSRGRNRVRRSAPVNDAPVCTGFAPAPPMRTPHQSGTPRLRGP